MLWHGLQLGLSAEEAIYALHDHRDQANGSDKILTYKKLGWGTFDMKIFL